MLAAAVKGSSQGLHSRAKPLLDLLLQEDLLTPDHFSTHQVCNNMPCRRLLFLLLHAAAAASTKMVLTHICTCISLEIILIPWSYQSTLTASPEGVLAKPFLAAVSSTKRCTLLLQPLIGNHGCAFAEGQS